LAIIKTSIRNLLVALAIIGSGVTGILSCRAADNDFLNGSANTGERLFLETRFAEFFFTNSGGNANAVFTNGDSAVSNEASIYGPLPGPFVKARAGLIRNGDPRLAGILMDTNATVPLASFLRSLNEDYTDIPCPCQ
jgi:hypothetical protein